MNPDPASRTDAGPLFCDRCMAELFPGKGNFYRVNIEAVADPSPPDLEPETDASGKILQLLEQLRDVSAQEALDQVHRRLTLFLCITCYREWIENPTG
jgi:hypothetical protein